MGIESLLQKLTNKGKETNEIKKKAPFSWGSNEKTIKKCPRCDLIGVGAKDPELNRFVVFWGKENSVVSRDTLPMDTGRETFLMPSYGCGNDSICTDCPECSNSGDCIDPGRAGDFYEFVCSDREYISWREEK